MNNRVVVLEVVAKPLYWIILAVSLWVLYRGHNEPGGGFIGGLLAVTATVLWAVAFGSQAAERRMPFQSPLKLAVAGVIIGSLAGVPAFFLGNSFLTHIWLEGTILSTVLVFDIGVFLCVWGALGGYALALMYTSPEQEGGAS